MLDTLMNICIVSIKTFSCTISVIIYETSKELTNTYTSANTYLTKIETRGKTVSSLPVFLFHNRLHSVISVP